MSPYDLPANHPDKIIPHGQLTYCYVLVTHVQASAGQISNKILNHNCNLPLVSEILKVPLGENTLHTILTQKQLKRKR